MTTADKKPGTHKPEFDGEWVRLEDVCAKGKSNLRQKDLKNDGPYPVYGAPGIVGFSSDYQNADAYVAVVKDGAGVGRVMACEPRSSVLGTMQALLPGKGTDRDYLLHLVRSMDLGKGFTGSTIPHIYFKDYGKTLVRALSRGRQVEVANRLSGIDRLISQGKQQLSALDDLVKSRFVEMFGDPIEQPKYQTESLGEACTKIGSGATPRGGKTIYMDNGTPFIRSLNVHNGTFIRKNLAYIGEEEAKKLSNVSLKRGDVLLNITGASVARSCVLPDDLVGGRVNQHVAILRANQSVILPCILNATLTSESYQRFMLEGAQKAGATREAITKQDLERFRVSIPPLSLQQQFADFVAKVDKLGFDVQQQIEKLEILKQSLMQDYFG